VLRETEAGRLTLHAVHLSSTSPSYIIGSMIIAFTVSNVNRDENSFSRADIAKNSVISEKKPFSVPSRLG
jgi:hypothetical protein